MCDLLEWATTSHIELIHWSRKLNAYWSKYAMRRRGLHKNGAHEQPRSIQIQFQNQSRYNTAYIWLIIWIFASYQYFILQAWTNCKAGVALTSVTLNKLWDNRVNTKPADTDRRRRRYNLWAVLFDYSIETSGNNAPKTHPNSTQVNSSSNRFITKLYAIKVILAASALAS